MLLMPPQGDYRNSPSIPSAAFRQSVPYPGHPSHTSYVAPTLPRGYDIGKELAEMSLGSTGISDGARPKSSSTKAPYGGMFGAMPNYETQSQSSQSPFPPPGSTPTSGSAYRPYVPYNAASTLPNPLENNEKPAPPIVTSPRDTLTERQPDKIFNNRPPALHSRSSSLLYASKNA